MATEPEQLVDEPRVEVDPDDSAVGYPPEWYDRSSLPGDFMVMIADQTEEDYTRRAANRFCEYVDGTVYLHPAVEVRHRLNIQLLMVLLEGFASVRQAGIALTGPTAFKTRPESYLEPDLFVLPIGGESQIHGWFSTPPALLVVEVISRSTRSHDLKLKSSLYREAGVPEIYFIDVRDLAVIRERKTDEGYVTERFESGPVLSRAIPGFWFDASWLWARPRPNLMRCLDQILAGPPA